MGKERKTLKQRADEASIVGMLVGGLGFAAAILLFVLGAMYADAPLLGDVAPGDTTVEVVEIVPATGAVGYIATEAFCRDPLTKVYDAAIPGRNGFELSRELNGVQESVLVVIDPVSSNVLYSTYDNNTSEPVNAVITDGARKCFQDKVKAKESGR